MKERAYRHITRATAEDQLTDMQTVLPEVAKSYDGEAIFAPTHLVYAQKLGKSGGMMYHFGTSYEEKLETISGLSVVHKGVILGHPEAVKDVFDLELPAIAKQTDAVEPLAKQIETLTSEERARLLARLAISETKIP
jgi:hypothetical protein